MNELVITAANINIKSDTTKHSNRKISFMAKLSQRNKIFQSFILFSFFKVVVGCGNSFNNNILYIIYNY